MLKIYKTHLAEKTQLTADVYLFRFSLNEPKELNFVAGQYMILLIPSIFLTQKNQINNSTSIFSEETLRDKNKDEDTTLVRPHKSGIGEKNIPQEKNEEKQMIRRLYSIISPSFEKNSFALLVKMVEGGVGSNYLTNLKIGDKVFFQGPAGMFFLRKNNRPIIFLATGTGIAPIKSMLESYQSEHIHQLLFWGLRTYQDVYFLDELKKLKLKNSNFQFLICLSQEKNLEIIPPEERKYFILGHVDEGLRKITNLTDFDFYLCGSRQVVESLRQYLEKKGIPKNQVFFEKF